MKLLGLAAKATILVVVYIALVEPGFFGVIHQHFLRAAILLWLLGEVSRYFAIEIARRSALNRTVRNLLSSAYAVFALLIILEIVFVFMPQSHGAGYTLGARNWFDYFWSANEIGYRDKPLQEVDRGKPRILVVGDSFTAGHGIRNPDDTYVGQLRNLTSDNFEVLNLGRNGADTREELQNLRDYPLTPTILVLQYFGNDIERAAGDAGIPFQTHAPYRDWSRPIRLLLQGSFLLNYIYWQFPHADGLPYIEFLNEAYRDPDAMEQHLTDLGRFIEYSRDCSIPMIVVVFPFLRDFDGSEIFTVPITEYFQGNGVPVIEVRGLVDDIPPMDRVVNSNDGHASVLVHRRVAEALALRFMELGWLTGTTPRRVLDVGPACSMVP